jgi:hypothetical protein
MSRCAYCNKKLGIMEYKCKCNKLFCISHLQYELHSCTYNHKSASLENLKKSLEIGPLNDKLNGERI